ncbi:unnamed protein product [Leuciscus chuanchicus]
MMASHVGSIQRPVADGGTTANQDRVTTANQDRGTTANQDRGTTANQDRGTTANQDRGTTAKMDRSSAQVRQVLCKTCRTSVSTSRGNTTNLYQHLQKHHRQLYDECMAKRPTDENISSQPPRLTPKQTSIVQALESGTPYDKSSRRYSEITDAIASYLAKDMVPINTVTKDGFKNLILTLDKRYRIPSRTFFTQAIQNMYLKCRKKVEAELKEVKYYATTTDMWSSRTTEPYQSLTVHFICEDFELKSRCLQTSYFPTDHTGENIASALKDALAGWGLNEEGQVCVTTDNAANIIRAVEINGWTRLQCFSHRLHLAIENALKDDRVQRAVGVCKKLVSQFSYSWKKRMALTSAQKELNLPEHSLITECPTRWGTKGKMIARVLEQCKALNHVLSADKKTRYLTLTWQDIEVLESIHKALHPLQEFTDVLSGEDYVSVSYLKPVLHLLRTKTLAEDQDDTNLTRAIKDRVLQYLKEKYDDPATQELLDVTSFLDPRFKTNYISQDNIPTIKERMMTEMEEAARTEKRSRVSESQDLAAASSVKAKTLGSYFKISSISPEEPPSFHQVVEAELSSYLTASTIDGEENPLTWWKQHQVNFPRLSSTMACKKQSYWTLRRKAKAKVDKQLQSMQAVSSSWREEYGSMHSDKSSTVDDDDDDEFMDCLSHIDEPEYVTMASALYSSESDTDRV